VADRIRTTLAENPREGVEKLIGGDLESLTRAGRAAEVEEFANAGSVAVARDTWLVEQLQRHRVRALLVAGKRREALAAAKGLFNVSGLGSTPYCIQTLADCLKAARPEDLGVVNRFKWQQLALAAEDPKVRAEQSKDLGPLVMDSIEVDPKPFEAAIEARKDASDYDGLYAKGNLLLLAGRCREARELFQKLYETAPERELAYAAEGLAKAIKAEHGSLGRCNEFVLSIRPRPQGETVSVKK
jgi:tetratricopeptide (TPR) repeat protein